MNTKNLLLFTFLTISSASFLHAMENLQSTRDPQTSPDILIKYRAMAETPEYIQYRAAEITHKKYNTADTLYILDLCKTELRNTKEYQAWMLSIKNTRNKKSTRLHQQTTYHFTDATKEEIDAKIKFAQETKKRREDAFDVVKRTPQFQHYLATQAQYEKDKSPMNLLRLKQCKYLLDTLPESIEFCKARADERLLLAIHRGYVGPIVVEQNYPSCWVDYVEQEKMMHKLDLDVFHIQQKNTLIVYISQ